ncbi:MAG: hypothetical protein DRP51_07515 [Candidatus Zixiibacteriota bacterium]|nr:MAG: hypothetical protein DRP51_07515 [candidate division Zixibacteria bacterium]
MRRLTIFLIFAGLAAIISCGENEDFDSLAKKGLAAYHKDDYNEAIHLFEKALHLKPSDRDMLYNTGSAFFKLDLLDSALVYFHRVNILYPADYAINKELFRLCSLTEDYECALSAVQMMIANGDNEEMFWIPLADLNFFIGNYKLAKKYYQQLIDKEPREGRYRWNLAECFARLNKPEEAIRVLKEAIAKLGANPVAYSQIAVNHITLREFDQAEIYFRKAIEFDPQNVSLWINLAHTLNEQNSREKKEEALAIYKLYYIDTPEMFKLDSLIKVLEVELGQK